MSQPSDVYKRQPFGTGTSLFKNERLSEEVQLLDLDQMCIRDRVGVQLFCTERSLAHGHMDDVLLVQTVLDLTSLSLADSLAQKMCIRDREKLALAAKGLAEILELDEAKLLEKFNDRRSNDCLLRYRVERERCV